MYIWEVLLGLIILPRAANGSGLYRKVISFLFTYDHLNYLLCKTFALLPVPLTKLLDLNEESRVQQLEDFQLRMSL